jgi:hypothetical protein
MSGTIPIEEKMLRSLKSAVAYLENSALASEKEDEGLLADNVWHAAAELEYALFLLSIATQSENGVPESRSNRRSKEVDVGSTLVDVKSLMNKTQEFVLGGRLKEAYESAYAARNRLLTIKEILAKKRRAMLKKK